jgi:ribosome-associated protein
MTDEEIPSKSERKRQMHELQDLGAQLVELSEQQLAAVPLPESLLAAVIEARRVPRFEARRRQLQYIGKLMRFIDAGPIRAWLEANQNAAQADVDRLHLIEHWRERLLAEEAVTTASTVITELVAAHPRIDVQRVRLLVRNTQHERTAGKPPRSYRALFQVLRDALAAEDREQRAE